jgi:hypothetical protein
MTADRFATGGGALKRAQCARDIRAHVHERIARIGFPGMPLSAIAAHWITNRHKGAGLLVQRMVLMNFSSIIVCFVRNSNQEMEGLGTEVAHACRRAAA